MDSVKSSNLHEPVSSTGLLKDLAVLLSIPRGESLEPRHQTMKILEDAKWLTSLAKILKLSFVLVVELREGAESEEVGPGIRKDGNDLLLLHLVLDNQGFWVLLAISPSKLSSFEGVSGGNDGLLTEVVTRHEYDMGSEVEHTSVR